MVLRIYNHGASAQTRYAQFTLPLSYVAAQSLGDHIDLGSSRVASKQWDDGRDAIYSVSGTWASGSATATLSATTDPGTAFSLRSCFGSSVCGAIDTVSVRCIPRIVVVKSGLPDRVITPSDPNGWTITNRIDGTLLKQRIWKYSNDGWHVEHAMNFHNGQAVADVCTSVMWCDVRAPIWSTPCDSIRYEYGHEVVPYFENENWASANGGRHQSFETTFTNGSGSNDYYSWAGNMWHGRRIILRGWMLGRDENTSGADTTLFGVIETVDVHGSETEWAGAWLYSGAVPEQPTNASSIFGPNWADTTRNYVSWDRGIGASDPTGGVGPCFVRYGNSPGLSGALGLNHGGSILYGNQRLRDYSAAIINHAMRPNRYVTLAGEYWRPSTVRNEKLCLLGFSPHQGSTGEPFLRTGGGQTYPPNSNNTTDGFDAQHRVNPALTTYYSLAKHDYAAWLLLRDWVYTMSLDTRRGGGFTIGSSMSGSREVGRMVTSLANPMAVAPELAPECLDIFVRGFRDAVKANLSCRRHLPLGSYRDGWSSWMFEDNLLGGDSAQTLSNGVVLRRIVQPVFEAIGTIGLWTLWKETGDTTIRDMYYEVAGTVVLHGTINLPLGGTYSTTVAGWWPGGIMRVDGWTAGQTIYGRAATDQQRTEGHPDFTKVVNNTYGEALRRWGIGGYYLASRIHPDPLVRARAASVVTVLQGGTSTPIGWIHSYFKSAGALS